MATDLSWLKHDSTFDEVLVVMDSLMEEEGLSRDEAYREVAQRVVFLIELRLSEQLNDALRRDPYALFRDKPTLLGPWVEVEVDPPMDNPIIPKGAEVTGEPGE